MKFLFWLSVVMSWSACLALGHDFTRQNWPWVAGDAANLAALTMTTIILHKKAYP